MQINFFSTAISTIKGNCNFKKQNFQIDKIYNPEL